MVGLSLSFLLVPPTIDRYFKHSHLTRLDVHLHQARPYATPIASPSVVLRTGHSLPPLSHSAPKAGVSVGYPWAPVHVRSRRRFHLSLLSFNIRCCMGPRQRWSDGAMSHVRQENVGFGCLSWCCRESVPSTVSPSKRKSRSRIRGVETEATMIVTPHFAHDLFFFSLSLSHSSSSSSLIHPLLTLSSSPLLHSSPSLE